LKSAEVIISIILFLLGVALTYQSMELSYMYLHAPGPGFLPFWIGVLFALLSLSLLISSLCAREIEKTIWPNRRMAFKLLAIVMVLLFYILSIDFLGYTISTVVFCASLIKILLTRCRWVHALIIANMVSIPISAVFQMWFGVPLPKGIFGVLNISTILIILAVVSILLFLYSRLRRAGGDLPPFEES